MGGDYGSPMVKLNNNTLSHGDVLVSRSRNVGEPSKTSYNACIILREADSKELRVMRLDPFVSLLGFRNGDSLASEAHTAPSWRGNPSHQDF
jgi:hypothetical protein